MNRDEEQALVREVAARVPADLFRDLRAVLHALSRSEHAELRRAADCFSAALGGLVLIAGGRPGPRLGELAELYLDGANAWARHARELSGALLAQGAHDPIGLRVPGGLDPRRSTAALALATLLEAAGVEAEQALRRTAPAPSSAPASTETR